MSSNVDIKRPLSQTGFGALNGNKPMAEGRSALIILVEWKKGARAAGFARLAFGHPAQGSIPGLVFLKLLGSGAGGGFTLAPSFSHQGLFASFETDADAERFLASKFVDEYRAHAVQFFAARLAAYSTRGAWSGSPVVVPVCEPPDHEPIAALTRGSVRPQAAYRFWNYAPQAQASLLNAEGCLLAAGLGEAPLLRQATFSIWESHRAMNAYARQGVHGAAIAATQKYGFFSESLFARFAIRRVEGAWNGFNTTGHQLVLPAEAAE